MAMDIGGTLKQKTMGVPVWVWALMGTAALSLFLINRRGKSSKASDQAAANQTATNLGSASQLQNLFAEAFPMNYMGGDIYVNQTVDTRGPRPDIPHAPHGSTTPPILVPPPSTQPPVQTPNPSPSPLPTPRPVADSNPYEYRVQGGDSWWSIAQKFGMTVDNLKAFNMGTGYGSAGRPASTIATLIKRGDTLFRNEEIDIPHKGTIFSGSGGA